MERYTRKDAEKALERLCAATGRTLATDWNDVGGLLLDYAPAYGGYVVAEIVSSSGGQGRPLGDRRMSARDFCQHVNFAIRAFEMAR